MTNRRIKKFVSINLLGETPKEEKERIHKERVKMILAGKTPIEVREMSKFKGATPYQLRRRRNILKKAGLPYKIK